RIHHHLADLEPAGHRHRVAREERPRARHAAPHVDSLVVRRPFVRKEDLAHLRVDAVAADEAASLRGSAVFEFRYDLILLFLIGKQFRAQYDRIGTKTDSSEIQKRFMQLRSMDRELRPFVAGEPPPRLAVDELAEAVVEAELLRLHRDGGERLLQPELGEL